MKRVLLVIVLIIMGLSMYNSRDSLQQMAQLSQSGDVTALKAYKIPTNSKNLYSTHDKYNDLDDYNTLVAAIITDIIKNGNIEVSVNIDKETLSDSGPQQLLNDVTLLLNMLTYKNFDATGQYIDYGTYYTMSINIVYLDGEADITKCIDTIDSIINTARAKYPSSITDQIWYINGWLVNNCKYDHIAAETYTPEEANNMYQWQASGPLVYGSAVCGGYAKAFKLAMDQLGVACIYATGSLDGVGHAWNYVCIDGYWYAVDVTGNDPQFLGGDPNLIDRIQASTDRLFMDNNKLEMYGYSFNESEIRLGLMMENEFK